MVDVEPLPPLLPVPQQQQQANKREIRITTMVVVALVMEKKKVVNPNSIWDTKAIIEGMKAAWRSEQLASLLK